MIGVPGEEHLEGSWAARFPPCDQSHSRMRPCIILHRPLLLQTLSVWRRLLRERIQVKSASATAPPARTSSEDIQYCTRNTLRYLRTASSSILPACTTTAARAHAVSTRPADQVTPRDTYIHTYRPPQHRTRRFHPPAARVLRFLSAPMCPYTPCSLCSRIPRYTHNVSRHSTVRSCRRAFAETKDPVVLEGWLG